MKVHSRDHLAWGIGLALLSIVLISVFVHDQCVWGRLSGKTQSKSVRVTRRYHHRGSAFFEVVYIYKVEGKTYRRETNVRLSHEPGWEMPVFYDPANPKTSRLGEGTEDFPTIMLVVGIIAGFFSVCCFAEAFGGSS